MAAMIRGTYKVSAQDATTVTLAPVPGDVTKGDLADGLSQIVLTFSTARDAHVFDIVNRMFELRLEKK